MANWKVSCVRETGLHYRAGLWLHHRDWTALESWAVATS